MLSRALLSVLVASSSALAFRDTAPLLIWSSIPSDGLRDASDVVSSGVIAAEDVYGTISSLGCAWGRMVAVRVDELHQSHVASLKLPSADLHIPYLVRPDGQLFDHAIDDWARLCGAEITNEDGNEVDGRSVMKLDVGKNDLILSDFHRLPSFDILIIHGAFSSPSPFPTPLQKRQEQPFPSEPSSVPSSPTEGSDTNSTLPTGGSLLDRVQLLTTPVIMALLISLAIFVPLIGFGVSALAGIQVPPRMMEISKGLIVGKERKDQ